MSLLVCAGLPRSGSTVQYQVASKVVEHLKIGKQYWHLSRGALILNHGIINSPDWHVIKTHFWIPELNRYDKSKIRVLITFRDLRAMCLSSHNFFGSSYDTIVNKNGFPKGALDLWATWHREIKNIQDTKYESFIEGDNLYKEARRIARFLGHSLTEQDARRIAKVCTSEANQQRFSDHNKHKKDSYGFNTKKHITGGSNNWREELPEWVIETINKRAAGWLKNKGYKL